MIWGTDIGVRSLHMVGLPITEFEEPWFFSFETKKASRWEELQSLTRYFQERVLFTDSVFIEEPPLAGMRNVRTLLLLAQTSGALLAASAAKTYLVAVSQWKKEVVGHGSADKAVVSAFLAQHYPDFFARADGNQNLVDATCIALYGQAIIEGAAGKGL